MVKAEINRSSNKQLAINILSTVISYGLTFGISFFLTPYIVKKLGTSAYGFLGLSSTIIGYTSLLTVALNSMAGRFVSLKYHEGDFDQSNRYLASTFFANNSMALFIVLVLGIITFFFEALIQIPTDLVYDVKFLFTLMFVNSAISLATNVFGISTFIKNRLELSNIRGMISNIIRAVLILILYGFFPAHLWYMGAIALICSAYQIYTNYYFFRNLTPELKISSPNFSTRHVMEMMKAGAWNVISSLSNLLNQGFELLLANIFISAYFMGILSISKTIPLMVLGIFNTLAANFSPDYVKLYAAGDMEDLKRSFLKAVKILGLFAAIPSTIVLSFGDIFYAAWLPDENYMILYYLTCIASFVNAFVLPSEGLWFIFTLTNTVKKSSLNLLWNATVTFILVLVAMFVCETPIQKIYAIVIIRSSIGLFRVITFLPIYGAKVLNLPRYTFIPPILRNVCVVIIATAISLVIKYFLLHNYNWSTFFIGAFISSLLAFIFCYFLNLNKSERHIVRTKFLLIKH